MSATQACRASIERLAGVTAIEEHGSRLDVTYRATLFSIEVRSVSESLQRPRRDGAMLTKYECSTGGVRLVKFDDGSEVRTTSYKMGEFDLMAVQLPNNKFTFVRSLDMPTLEATGRNLNKYTRYQLEHLVKRTVPLKISDGVPLPPYRTELRDLLDEMAIVPVWAK